MSTRIVLVFGLVAALAALAALQPKSALAGETVAKGQLAAAFTSFPRRPSAVGSWRLVSEGDRLALELEDDFSAKKGPDVKFFLSPLESSVLTGGNATAGSVFIVQLESFSGAQRFLLPKGTDPAEFRSLVLHCEAYSKLWGRAALEPSKK